MSTNDNKTQPYHHGNLRAALLNAAEQEIGENGLEGFSLRRVARRAEVSHNAPSHHFKDVQGLLTALATVGFQRLVQVQDKRVSTAPEDEREQFIALGLGYIEFATDYPALFRLMYSSGLPDRQDRELMGAMMLALEKLSTHTRAARNRNGGDAPLDIKDMIAAWVMVHGFADLVNSGLITALLSASGRTRDEVAREVLMHLDF